MDGHNTIRRLTLCIYERKTAGNQSSEASCMKFTGERSTFRIWRRKSLFLLPLVATCLFLIFQQAQAQQITGTLTGTVTDTTGAVVSGATVRATDVATGFSRSAPTNAEGEYRIEFLPVGSYVVDVTATGFKKFRQENIVLTVD